MVEHGDRLVSNLSLADPVTKPVECDAEEDPPGCLAPVLVADLGRNSSIRITWAVARRDKPVRLELRKRGFDIIDLKRTDSSRLFDKARRF